MPRFDDLPKSPEERLDALEPAHQKLRQEYDQHIVYGSAGGVLALLVIVIQFVMLFWR